ncbi:ATP-dependent DNA helicase [Corynebacterium suranareeae]|uniref:ATP-dependent DNA helicase n=1 Tax=Corynebacterium suranareeae TaxID=2506452 RepID=A0A169S509_9CORY|nr:ATP-binding protein [Corynebacterium suranareeae]BAU97151.1 ATP-dependent DNA helicase [Corynebacterium suranareeae]
MSTIVEPQGRKLPPEILRAIESIEAGEIADSQESETLDFKEDPSFKGRGNDAKLVEVLTDASVCFANGPGGDAHLILGIADKTPGTAAFTGTLKATSWIEQRIFANTRPNLRVEAEEIFVNDQRLIWIRIPKAYTLYERTKGQATRRIGTDCIPMSTEDRRVLIAQRANPDHTAVESALSIDELDSVAIAAARALLVDRRTVSGQVDTVPPTTRGLLEELGLLTRSGQLTVAAEILFAPLSTGRVSIRHLHRAVPGGDPRVREISTPLVLAFQEILNRIAETSSAEIDRIFLKNGQEIPIPAFPAKAVDEVIANALIHRDWNMSDPVVIDQSPRTLSVWSPGPLPHGVTQENLLTTVSQPRNRTLMSAMRILGLAEESSRGFDRMWVSMLSTGRRPPAVRTTDTSVEVIISAGRPDTNFVKGILQLSQDYSPEAVQSVLTLVVLRHLFDHPLITLQEVRTQTQSSDLGASELMDWLDEIGLVAAVGDSNKEWTAGPLVLQAFGEEEKTAEVPQGIQGWIEDKLSAGKKITAKEVADELGVPRMEVTETLRMLRQLEKARIDPEGPQRGPTTRWVAW